MIVPFVALIVIIIGVILFFVLAGKKKQEGRDLGDRGAGNPVHQAGSHHP